MSSVRYIHLVSNFNKNWKKCGGKKGEVKTQNTQEDPASGARVAI
jgi:hypothetical protein